MKPSLVTIGVALLAGAATASAQTIITREVAGPPSPVIITQPAPAAIYAPEPLSPMPAGTFVAPQPVQTVETVETIRTMRPARAMRRQVSTSRQVVRSRKASKAVVTPVRQQTIYRTVVRRNVAPPTVITDPDMSEPTYTTVAPAPDYVPPVAVQTQVPANVYTVPSEGVATVPVVQPYRYVYDGDRILVIDPNTNIAISAIPR